MYPNIDESPVDKDIISNYDILADLIYNPMDTKFLQFGKMLNKITVGGLYMLVGQAIKSQEILQDIEICKDVIEEIYEVISRDFS